MSFLADGYTELLKSIRALFSATAPNAAQAWAASEGDAEHDYWLFCAPVHMLLGRDCFFLTAPAPIAVSVAEASALMLSLNQHFSEQGHHFYLQNNTWFLGLNHNPNITTTAINIAENKDVAPFLPKGEGALVWATLQNEIQMLLFSHAVNEKREQLGLPMINSLWCYGVGRSEGRST